jgi:hypothetical protein
MCLEFMHCVDSFRCKFYATCSTVCLVQHKPDEEGGCENDSLYTPGS